MNDIVMYCPQLNQLLLYGNKYNLPLDIAIELIRLALKDGLSLEYIGEL